MCTITLNMYDISMHLKCNRKFWVSISDREGFLLAKLNQNPLVVTIVSREIRFLLISFYCLLRQ